MKNYGIAVILIIAAILRLSALSAVPPSPSLDEVSLGYNAYSILKTGRDEYGTPFPFLLRAYDDWRPAPYVYLVMPFLPVFGLTSLAVRLPSALAGTLTVLLTYFLVLELYRPETLNPKHQILNKSKGSNAQNSKHLNFDIVSDLGFRNWDFQKLALTSAMLLALSPWHIYLSRLGHEVNLGLVTTVLAVYLFVLWTKRQNEERWLLASAAVFGLTLWSYQSQKVITPILVFGLGVLWWREIWGKKRLLYKTAAIAVLVGLPAVAATFTGGGLIRLSGTSAFSGDHQFYAQSVVRLSEAKEKGDVFGQLIYSRKFTHIKVFVANYLSHFNPRWLFDGSIRENHKVPNMGLLYTWELPFVLLGLWFFLRRGIETRRKIVFLLWLLASPLPAAITTQAPHAMRAFTMAPALATLTAWGIWAVADLLPKRRIMKLLFVGVLLTFISTSLYRLQRNYFVIFPKTQSDSFQLVLAQAIPYVLAREGEYDRIVFSNQNSLYQSYMFFLFFSRYDPGRYLAEGGTASGGFAETHKFGKYEFRPIHWQIDITSPKTLLVGNPNDFPTDAAVIAAFYYLDGREGIRVVKTIL